MKAGWNGGGGSLRRKRALLLLAAATAAIPPVGRPAGAATSTNAPLIVNGAPVPAYHVNAGDELDIFIWGEDRLQRPVRVLPDGSFAFPLAGTIAAEGLTPRQIADIIRERIRPNYRDAVPDVTVSVRDPAGMRFYVVGKVRSPGSFPIGRSVNVVQALSLAGGPAEFADVSDAVILRQTPKGQTVDRVNLSDVLKGGRALRPGPQAVPLPELRTGDVLVVP